MSELLIFAKDYSIEPSIKPDQYAGLPKVGDVIAWCPDGWLWGTEELGNPLFRIMSWPGADEGHLDSMLGYLPPKVDPDMKQTTYAQYRANAYNFAAAPQEVADWFADEERSEQKFLIDADVNAPNNYQFARADIAVVDAPAVPDAPAAP